MQAIAIAGGKGPASALHLAQIETPQPKPGEILIRVHAAGVNRPTSAARRRLSAAAGCAADAGARRRGRCGDRRRGLAEGDEVCALLGGGGYAQYATVDARHALPLPDRAYFR